MRLRALKVRMLVDSLAPMMILSAVLAFSAPPPALAADDSKVKNATEKVETGAKKIGHGEIGDGTKETTRGSVKRCPRAPSTPARS